jgi:drug/metabolite transporter (DMT)-like permease
MEYLALAVLCSVGIATIIKYAGIKGYPSFVLFATNYLVATIGALIGSGGKVAPFSDPPLLLLTVFLGGLFIWCFWILMMAVKKLGMVLPVTLMRISAVIPTLASIVLFGEAPVLMQIIGIALAFIALPLAARGPVTKDDIQTLFGSGFGWGLVLFFSYGLTDFMFKLQKEHFPVGNLYEVLVVIFGTAFVIGTTTMLVRKEKISTPVVLSGVLLGILNMFAAYFFMSAIAVLPGVVVFPVNGIGVILLSTVVGVLLWKEKLAPRNYIALALAVAALLFLS